MKKLHYSLIISMLVVIQAFSQKVPGQTVDWYRTCSVIPMENTEDVYPARIEYYTLMRDGIVYFNWSIKSVDPGEFVVEESYDGSDFRTVDLVKCYPCPVPLWYGVQIKTACKNDCPIYRVVLVLESEKSVTYPNKEVVDKYEVTVFEKTTQRRWAKF